jgi:biopolymer transport protein ExbB
MFTEFDWIGIARQSPAMVVLIICSIVTVGVAIERVYYFWLRRGNPDRTAREVTQRVQRGEIKEALWTCEHSGHPVGAALQVIVGSQMDRPENIDEKLQVVLTNQKLLLERNLNVLGTMAAVAPLVGLLGTVWGIMRAFHDMALVGSAAPSVVAAGIAEALVTTAIGLLVAVPALMLYNHFARRMSVMLIMAENHARGLRTAMNGSGGTPGARTRTKDDPTAHPVRGRESVSVG